MKLRRNPFLGTLAVIAMAHSAHAASGTWNVNADELWSTAGNWSSSTIADDLSSTASFTNDITADRTVHLDGDRTLNKLVFSDSTPATAGSWILDNNGVSTNNLILSGTTGAAAGTAPVIDVGSLGSNKTATISAIIQGTYGLTKTGAGTLILSGNNSFTGGLKLDGGTLRYTADQTTSVGALTFGATTGSANASTLDLSTKPSNLTASSLTVQTNSATANTISIGTEKTLTINGNVAIGDYTPTAAATTKLSATGTGTLTTNIGTGTFLIGTGGSTTIANAVSNDIDLSGLATFNLNSTTNASLLRMGNNGANVGTNSDTLTLATTSTIHVGTIELGYNQRNSGTQTLELNGSGTNTIQANTISVGTGTNATGGGRGIGVLQFSGAGSGTVTIADYAGTGGANMNISANGTASTSATAGGTGTVDLTGHEATVTLSNLYMSGAKNASTFKFDTGTLGIGTAYVGLGGASTAVATLQIGSTSASTGTATIGSLVLANNNSTGTLNVLGGTLTMGGTIMRGATGTGTVKVSGGTLDMASHSIGTATALVILTAESGTIQNVTTINGTGGLTKTTAGTLTLTGANTYSGATTVTAGTLAVGSGGSIANSSQIIVGASTTFDVSAVSFTVGGSNLQTLSGTGAITGNMAVGGQGTLAIGSSPGTMTFAGDLGLNTGSVSNFEINGFTFGNYDLARAAAAGTQTVSFNGGTLNLLFQSGFSTNGTVKIFDFVAYAGSGFTSVVPTGLDPGFTASFDATNGLVTVIPEPDIAALLGGFGVLALLRRRRTARPRICRCLMGFSTTIPARRSALAHAGGHSNR